MSRQKSGFTGKKSEIFRVFLQIGSCQPGGNSSFFTTIVFFEPILQPHLPQRRLSGAKRPHRLLQNNQLAENLLRQLRLCLLQRSQPI